MSGPTFPGGTAVSWLDVYDSEAPDGCSGGTPHLHLVSTEAYVVTAGRGVLQSLTAEGFLETPLHEGAVVWFTAGTIHRAVNLGRLRMVVLMSNAGLPEAGDAVMTFPPEVLSDGDTYAAAADLGAGPSRAERARQRRDLAVEGFSRLRHAVEGGNPGALTEFYTAAASLVRDRAGAWSEIVDGPLAQARLAAERARAVAAGDSGHLRDGSVCTAAPSPGERGFGMCGRLRTYDLRGEG
ncbi:cupin domain-containing protein [uncultured Leifsonia sp.]|uniref:cupin domain-containing protein n=1 Tax=uncultured Leifsonia sp. TaxID=340359 RepID=UPI0028D7D208|nr:cupin domain-containing protein [uncultured Leifsonia sp.]